MKTIVCLFSLLLAMIPAWSQNLSGQVSYTYSTKFDGFLLPRQAQLSFAKGKSLFVHSQGNGPKIFDRNGQEVSMEEAMKVDPTNKGQLFGAYFQDPTGDVYYTDFKAKKMIFREIVVHKAFLVEEPDWISFDWKLEAEKKQIGKFSCQKARTNFRGRTYVAWFSSQIPVSHGPWKFHGLPGLILEVSDEKGEVSFVAKEIQIPGREEVSIIAPTTGEKVSLEAFMEAEYNIKKAMVDAQRASAERKEGQKQEYGIGKINRVETRLK